MTNIRLSHLNDCIAQAKNDLTNCRAERSRLLCDMSGFTIGQEFEIGGQRYKVEKITASEREDAVWLTCKYWTSSKRWSQGTKPVHHKVGP